MIEAPTLTFSPAELVEVTRCKRPGDQLKVLHERGFVRATILRGTVLLERAHYESVIAGTYGTARVSVEPAHEPEGWHPWRAAGVSPDAWMSANWRSFAHGPETALAGAVAPHLVGEISGVYLLFEDRQLVYVGESVNVPARLDQHVVSKSFDAAFAFATPEMYRRQIECAYIQALNPALNRKTDTGAVEHLADELRRPWGVQPCGTVYLTNADRSVNVQP